MKHLLAQSLLNKVEEVTKLKSLKKTRSLRVKPSKTAALYSATTNSSLVLCLNQPNYCPTAFPQAVSALKNILKAKLIYVSSSKSVALTDCLANFPEIFRLNRRITLLVEKNDYLASSISADKSTVFSKIYKAKTESKLMKTVSNFKPGLFESTIELPEDEEGGILDQGRDNIDFQINFSYFVDNLVANQEYLNFITRFDDFPSFQRKLSQFDRVQLVKKMSSQIENSMTSDQNNVFVVYHTSVGQVKPSFNPKKANIIEYKNNDEVNLLANIVADDCGLYSRCLLVLRPILVRSGLNKQIVELLRINRFSIIKEEERVLSDSEVNVLFKLEGLDSSCFPSYKRYMQESQSEILVLSKFNAVKP